MRVVVIEERRVERDSIVRALKSDSWVLEAFGERAAGLAALRRQAPDVLVLGWTAPAGGEHLRLALEAICSGATYVLVVIDPGARGREIAASMAGGAHDFVLRPLVPEELVARVGARQRLRRWARIIAETERQSQLDVTRLHAWQNMGHGVCQELAQMVSEAVEPRDGWPDGFHGSVEGATIAMSLPSDLLEFRISVVADEPSLRWFATVLLGHPNVEKAALDDLLRELASTAGGSFKRAALVENVTLTTGIPVTDAAARPRGEGVRCWTAVIRQVSRLAIVGELLRRERVCLPASKLCEGMVVISDVRNAAGGLLIPAGTRLTSSAVERVTETLGPHVVVEVADVTSVGAPAVDVPAAASR